jgi:CDP-4-dehydro-6-deoxyglucose reductase, E3
VTEVGYSVPKASGESSPDAASANRVSVTLWETGQPRAVEAYEGESLMLALKRAGLPLLAVCGGQGACGTCKVAFPPEWADRLSPPEKRELRLLTHLKSVEGERLSCRITLSAALEGLEVDACE